MRFIDRLIETDCEIGNHQRSGAIDRGGWGYRVTLLSGRADSAKHAIDARDGGEFACPIDS